MSGFEFGDKVRLNVEAEVSSRNPTGLKVDGKVIGYLTVQGTELLEKIEPPVEVFQPGVTVRSKSHPEYMFSIGRGGYFDHTNGVWLARPEQKFTSKSYEWVDLA